MSKYIFTITLFLGTIFFSFQNKSNSYTSFYYQNMSTFNNAQSSVLSNINSYSKENIKHNIHDLRIQLKKVDFWLRYLQPLHYKKINAPLPVEWETEVFDKHESPYKRIGAGLTLAELYLEEDNFSKDSLFKLISASINSTQVYMHDSVMNTVNTFDHFYFCNRLFLLNLATIYNTGFECPDTNRIIPELKEMVKSTQQVYITFNESYKEQAISEEYLKLYQQLIIYLNTQPNQYSHFNHFEYIQKYINPLYSINQTLIKTYKASSKNNLDFSLNKNAKSIFDKKLYEGQNTKGIFLRVKDSSDLQLIKQLGELLFYDPILSGNNERSCASCHAPEMMFTDTTTSTSKHFDKINFLKRNSPSLINAPFQHLAMHDGKFITLQKQAIGVMTNPDEMNGKIDEIVKKVLSCKTYLKGFKKLLKYTPQEPEIGMEHIASALTYYYGQFSEYYADFDNAMIGQQNISQDVIKGFNLFMSKAQCATCHFVPQFNGVKPPYISSEFEVLGTPNSKEGKQLSEDNGRYNINHANETHKAFRTNTVRNSAKTSFYMHNGVYKTLDEVIKFYNIGGGQGLGLNIENQTLSGDSLHLNPQEINQLKQFIYSLNENIPPISVPQKLPESKNKILNIRKIRGVY